MSQFRSLSNTDKEYPCTACASKNVSIIREDPSGSNPRLKCGSCSFMFNALDSQAAVEAGAIKPSSAEALASASEPEITEIPVGTHTPSISPSAVRTPSSSANSNLCERPAYVFLSKPRGTVEFCTKKDFRRTAVRWHDVSHDVYELNKIKLNVKVDVS